MAERRAKALSFFQVATFSLRFGRLVFPFLGATLSEPIRLGPTLTSKSMGSSG
jgi:hypothetical protein